jgi:hypothetical protein
VAPSPRFFRSSAIFWMPADMAFIAPEKVAEERCDGRVARDELDDRVRQILERREHRRSGSAFRHP